jgi:RNA polymerase sigma factor (sigma-70 family)
MNFNRNGGFATTRWTVVLAAGRDETPASAPALAQLCERYWPPLYSYARRRGYSVEHAQDLTQAFFVRFLEKRDVQSADRQRGKFRSFLLASFKHFLANEYDREHAKKRGGGQQVISLEIDTAEARYSAEPVDELTPESLFERHWAQGVLDRAFAALRAECTKSGKATMFAALSDYLIGEKQHGGYVKTARLLGTSEGAVKVTVHRLRRRLRDLLKAEIGTTVSEDSEIEEEIRYLIAVLTTPL